MERDVLPRVGSWMKSLAARQSHFLIRRRTKPSSSSGGSKTPRFSEPGGSGGDGRHHVTRSNSTAASFPTTSCYRGITSLACSRSSTTASCVQGKRQEVQLRFEGLVLAGVGAASGNARRRCCAPYSSRRADAKTAEVPTEVALIQALDLESRLGFCNLKGKRYASFHLFLLAQLRDFNEFSHDRGLHSSRRDLLAKTERYPAMTTEERKHTLGEVRRFLEQYWQLKAKGTSEPASSSGARAPVQPSDVTRREVGATLKDIEPFNLFFFDVETTGLSSKRDRIVEIAITALHSKEKWSCLIDPECLIPRQASAITGLTNEMLENASAPTFDKVVGEMVQFVKEKSLPISHATLVAHNVRFDSRFLQAEFTRAGVEVPENWRFFDSLEFARKVLGKDTIKSFSLQNLNSHFGLPDPEREHRAADDVNVLIQVFQGIIGNTKPDQVVKLITRDRIRLEPSRPTSHVDSSSPAGAGVASLKARPAEARNQRAKMLRPDPSRVMGAKEIESSVAVPSVKLPDYHHHNGFDPLQSREEDADLHEEAGIYSIASEVSGAREIEFLTSGIPMNSLSSFTPLQRQINAEAGFETLASLLQHYPRDYLLYSGDWNDGEFICSQGVVSNIKSFCKGNKGFIEATVECEAENTVKIKQWYHFRNYALAQRALRGMVARYPVDSIMAFKGKLKQRPASGTMWDLTGNVEMTSLDDFIRIEKQVIPVYPAKGVIKSGTFNKLIKKGLGACPPVDLLPLEVVKKYNLMRYKDALQGIHFPSTLEEANQARRSLVFQELFLLQTALMLRRYQLQTPQNNVDAKGIRVGTSGLLEHACKSLPYDLTSAQSRVLEEVLGDMMGAPPMMRLLQGDVGSGKTIVALLAMLSAVDAGFQAAFMVPTEILAVQQAHKLEEFLETLKLADSDFETPKVVVLTGSMKASEKKEAMEATANGAASITFGTHSLISEGVKFLKLGLAVIDEQHKFGVEQRSKLQSKNQPPPHLLSMSATPIPRTLALTMYGEMALSYIDEVPPGRQPITTSVYRQADEERRRSAYQKLVSEVQKGNKGFIVFPLIDSSENEDFQSIKAAEASFEGLINNELRGIPCGLLHGRLQPQEKLNAQNDFLEGRTKVLVATAVIEVGVDIPEASVIIVENSERFGLAQLHQLRGRVGRSSRKSHCFLLTGGADASYSRIKHMETLDNGFAVSELDLALRGAGDFIGTRQAGQSGLGSLLLADMSLEPDRIALEEAREAASGAFGDGEPKLGQSLLMFLQNNPPVPFLDVAPDNIYDTFESQ